MDDDRGAWFGQNKSGAGVVSAATNSFFALIF
jgi:hypothetical protein